MTRLIALFALMLSLAACGEIKDLDGPPEPMGRFFLGHNIVVSSDPEVGPLSRKATDEEWIASMTSAVDERFSRYDGDLYYHIAVKIEGYVLAHPGIPLVASPKSILVIGVTLWDDANERKINEEPEKFTIFERLSGETILGSGLTQTKEIQMQNLTRNAAKHIHGWMLENKHWFEGDPASYEVADEETEETTDTEETEEITEPTELLETEEPVE